MLTISRFWHARIYKALNFEYPMAKSELEQRHLRKGCYGTDEWSENSGICRRCEWKDDCGKIEKARTSNM